jgi:hypothetical protein
MYEKVVQPFLYDKYGNVSPVITLNRSSATDLFSFYWAYLFGDAHNAS